MTNKTAFNLKILLWQAGAFLAFLVLGAHYYRAGSYVMAANIPALIMLLFGKAAWKKYAAAAFLFIGSVEWCDTIYALIQWRMVMDLPYLRAAAILFLVCTFTFFMAVHNFKQAQTAANLNNKIQAAAFILTFAILYILRLQLQNILLLERIFPLFGSIQITLLAWYAAIIAGGLKSSFKSRKTRKIAWIIFGIIFFGQLFLGLAGFSVFRTLENMHFPVPGLIIFAPIFRGEIGFMPLLALGVTLIAGSAFCSMLCYFGSVESAIHIGSTSCKPVSNKHTIIRHARFAILPAGVFIAVILRAMNFAAASAIFFGAGFAIISLAVMFYGFGKKNCMFHCKTFCPLGPAINIAGKISPWRIKINSSICDNCGACEKVCAYNAINQTSRQKGGTALSCTLCRDCIAVCPKSAISIRLPFLSAIFAESAFIVLIVILHILFITAARPL